MILRVMRFLGVSVAALVAAAGCKDDPTASLAGKAFRVVMNRNPLFLGLGDSGNVTVQVIDESGTPLSGSITAASSAPAVATVVPVSGLPPDPNQTTAVFKVKGLTAAAAHVRFTGHGRTDSARVNVLPSPFVFDGALSSLTPAGGDTLTIDATGLFRFDPAKATVTFAGGIAAPVVAASATQVKVVVPFSNEDSLRIAGVSLPYVTGRTFMVPTPAKVKQTGDVYGTNDESFTTAPVMALPTAVGDATVVITNVGNANDTECAEIVLSFGSSGPCMIFQFTIASADPVDLTFTTDWDGDADMDVYACAGTDPAADCFEDGGGGATGDQPQTFTFAFPTGTHYFVAEQFDPGSGSPRNIVTTITRNKNTPSLTTTPSAGGAVGVVLNDDGDLAGGFSPTGSITFKLYDPDQATCTGTPRYQTTVTVMGNGTYSTSPGFTTDKAGIWRWTADYTGDTQNTTATSMCGDEVVTVS
jgi:hypothetical protein